MYNKIRKMDFSIKISLVGMSINALLLIIATFNYPNYNQFDQTLSKLGARWPSSLYFSLGIFIGALTISWLLILMKDDIIILFPNKSRQFQIIGIIFTFMVICMIGVIIFPSAGITSDIHDIIAVTLFILIAIATSWVSLISKSSLPEWNKYISFLGYSCSASVVVLGLLLIFWEYGPLVQKITILEFNFWVILVVYEYKQYAAKFQLN